MISAEELLERILILTTVNSTLIHTLISIEAEDNVGPQEIEKLAHGVRAVHDSVKQALSGSEEAESASGSSFVDDTINVILTHLVRIEEALNQLAVTRKAKAFPADVLSVTKPIAEAQQLVSETTVDLAGLTTKPFQRRLSVHDPKKRLAPTQQLLDKYSTRSHLLLPHYWFEACRELFRYNEPQKIITQVTQVASKVFHDLIRRLLSEAPCAGMLQELSRRSSTGIELTNNERNTIISDARELYNRLETSIHSAKSSDLMDDAKRALRSFDWGPPDVEKRVVGIFYRSAKELVDRAIDSKTLPDQKRLIYAELCRYLCDLSASIHQLPRFHQLLTEMKV